MFSCDNLSDSEDSNDFKCLNSADSEENHIMSVPHKKITTSIHV